MVYSGDLMNETDAVLLDIEGVLSVGGLPVEGAREAVDYLRDAGMPFRCISNTTRRSRKAIVERLGTAGFAIPEAHIFTPAVAASALLAGRSLTRCMLLVWDDVLRDFEAAGISPAHQEADAVVVGDAGDNFTYKAMNRAFRQLIEGAAFLALEKDRYWLDGDTLSLSAGPFVKGLEYATGREAELVGKPSRSFFEAALASIGVPPGRTLMVGDDILTDVGGAQRAGLKAALVKTGKYREDLVRSSGISPEIVIDSIALLPSILR